MFIYLSLFSFLFCLQYKAIVLVTLVAAVSCATFPSNSYSAQRQFYQNQLRQQQYQQQLQQQKYNPQRYYAPGADAEAQILRSDSTVNPDSFQYAYETSNGIVGQESGQLRQIGQEAAIVAQGQFSYTSPEGEPVSLSFVADENGYQPTVSGFRTKN